MSYPTVPSSHQRVSLAVTQPRATGPTPAQKVKKAFRSIFSALETAAPLVPGPGAIAAGVGGSIGRSVAASIAVGSGASSAVGGSLAEGFDRQEQLIALQQQISSENLRFTTYSNVLKSKHDTHKSIVNNYR